MDDMFKNRPSDLPFVYLKQTSFLQHACLLFVFPFGEFKADSSKADISFNVDVRKTSLF